MSLTNKGKSLRMILQENITRSNLICQTSVMPAELTLQAFQDLEVETSTKDWEIDRSAGANLTDPKNLQMIVQSMNQVRSAA